MTTTLGHVPPTLEVVLRNRDRILEVAARHGATNVGVFGSVARGDATEESDIDIIVDIVERLEHVLYFGQIGDLKREFSLITGYPVDVLDRLGTGQLGRDVIRGIIHL